MGQIGPLWDIYRDFLRSDFSSFWLIHIRSEKVPDLSQFGPIWPTLWPNLTPLITFPRRTSDDQLPPPYNDVAQLSYSSNCPSYVSHEDRNEAPPTYEETIEDGLSFGSEHNLTHATSHTTVSYPYRQSLWGENIVIPCGAGTNCHGQFVPPSLARPQIYSSSRSTPHWGTSETNASTPLISHDNTDFNPPYTCNPTPQTEASHQTSSDLSRESQTGDRNPSVPPQPAVSSTLVVVDSTPTPASAAQPPSSSRSRHSFSGIPSYTCLLSESGEVSSHVFDTSSIIQEMMPLVAASEHLGEPSPPPARSHSMSSLQRGVPYRTSGELSVLSSGQNSRGSLVSPSRHRDQQSQVSLVVTDHPSCVRYHTSLVTDHGQNQETLAPLGQTGPHERCLASSPRNDIQSQSVSHDAASLRHSQSDLVGLSSPKDLSDAVSVITQQCQSEREAFCAFKLSVRNFVAEVKNLSALVAVNRRSLDEGQSARKSPDGDQSLLQAAEFQSVPVLDQPSDRDSSQASGLAETTMRKNSSSRSLDIQETIWPCTYPGVLDSGLKWVRSASTGTNLRHFQIRFDSQICLICCQSDLLRGPNLTWLTAQWFQVYST